MTIDERIAQLKLDDVPIEEWFDLLTLDFPDLGSEVILELIMVESGGDVEVYD